MASAALAAVIVIALAFFLRAKVTSTGVPGGVQLFFEAITIQMRNQIESAIGMRIAPFVLPLAVTLFVYILISNWLSVLPVQYTDKGGDSERVVRPAGVGHQLRAGAGAVRVPLLPPGRHLAQRPIGYPAKMLKGHVWDTLPKAVGVIFSPINVVEELAKPISLSLRLFGNIFAGGILVALIALFPPYILWAPNAIWKAFDLFVGAIQAFIFALLTVLYFSQSMELEGEHH